MHNAVMAVALCARPEASKTFVSIRSSGALGSERLPIALCQRWPVWCADDRSLARVPSLDVPGGWVNPTSFEQLWLPQDLPAPDLHPAVALVLTNGTPRFICPAVDATVDTSDGQRWRNRGQCSVPLPATWLSWEDWASQPLRLSAHIQPGPLGDDPDDAPSEAGYRPLLQSSPVARALDAAAMALADAPAALADGFHFLVVRLPEVPRLGLDAAELGDGSRLRLFLSDVDQVPVDVSPADADPDCDVVHGECDLGLYAVDAGGTSPYLPEVYKALFQ